MSEPQSETVLREQNPLSLTKRYQWEICNIIFIWRSRAQDYWCENPFSMTNSDSWKFEQAESGHEEALHLSTNQIHRDLRDTNIQHMLSRPNLYHTWPDGERVDVAPEDEVVVPPPVVDPQHAGGAGEQPGLARAIESLTHSWCVG